MQIMTYNFILVLGTAVPFLVIFTFLIGTCYLCSLRWEVYKEYKKYWMDRCVFGIMLWLSFCGYIAANLSISALACQQNAQGTQCTHAPTELTECPCCALT